MFPGFGDVDGNPPVGRIEEIRPAVISGDVGGMFVGWQRETDFETRRNALRTGHGDEEGMKVGAITFLRIAGVEHIAPAPTGTGFVVAHGGEDVIVDGASFV